MSWLDPFNVFDPGKGTRAAMGQYKKGYEEAKKFQQPYNQAGLDQISRLMGAEDKLLDPAALQSEWAKTYETSPYAMQLMDQAKASGLDTAGSMGLLGSSSALSNIQQGASNIMQKDRENYMNQLMDKYKTGLGLGTNMFSTGAQTAGNMANQAMNFGEQMGLGEYNKANAPMNMLMNMIKMYMATQGGGF